MLVAFAYIDMLAERDLGECEIVFLLSILFAFRANNTLEYVHPIFNATSRTDSPSLYNCTFCVSLIVVPHCLRETHEFYAVHREDFFDRIFCDSVLPADFSEIDAFGVQITYILMLSCWRKPASDFVLRAIDSCLRANLTEPALHLFVSQALKSLSRLV